jgi:hypothetical protein
VNFAWELIVAARPAAVARIAGILWVKEPGPLVPPRTCLPHSGLFLFLTSLPSSLFLESPLFLVPSLRLQLTLPLSFYLY